MTRLRSMCVLALLSACASKPATRSTDVPPPVMQPSGSDARATCVSLFQRQRECTTEFIPALVALRVRLDVPPGIAEKDREAGRDALVSQAMEEWKNDSTDEAIGRTCDQMASADPEGIQKAQECLTAQACQPFVDCVIPIVEQHLQHR